MCLGRKETIAKNHIIVTFLLHVVTSFVSNSSRLPCFVLFLNSCAYHSSLTVKLEFLFVVLVIYLGLFIFISGLCILSERRVFELTFCTYCVVRSQRTPKIKLTVCTRLHLKLRFLKYLNIREYSSWIFWIQKGLCLNLRVYIACFHTKYYICNEQSSTGYN